MGTEQRVVLVTSAEAAAALSMTPEHFAVWANRRHLEPLRKRLRVGRSSVTIYDLEHVYRAAEEENR